jgi:hypothetical protein
VGLKLSGRAVCRVHCYLPPARFVIPIDDPNGAEVTADVNSEVDSRRPRWRATAEAQRQGAPDVQ